MDFESKPHEELTSGPDKGDLERSIEDLFDELESRIESEIADSYEKTAALRKLMVSRAQLISDDS